jgi:hypothetical protein
MKIKVENAYEDGHESTQIHEIDDAGIPGEEICPAGDPRDRQHKWVEGNEGMIRQGDTWVPNPVTFTYCEFCDSEKGDVLRDFLFQFTGDGTGENLNAWYEVTVLEAADPGLVGQKYEWG